MPDSAFYLYDYINPYLNIPVLAVNSVALHLTAMNFIDGLPDIVMNCMLEKLLPF